MPFSLSPPWRLDGPESNPVVEREEQEGCVPETMAALDDWGSAWCCVSCQAEPGQLCWGWELAGQE